MKRMTLLVSTWAVALALGVGLTTALAAGPVRTLRAALTMTPGAELPAAPDADPTIAMGEAPALHPGAEMPDPAQAETAGGDIAVVVNPNVPVNDLTFAEVRKLLLGDRQFWSSSLRVTLLIRAPAAREREVVLKTVYQMTEAQFRQYWIAKVFRAEAASGPKIVYSNEEASELVAGIPGSIAFVDASRVPKGLKVLRIDGRLPGEKGYRLR
jgi:ABC-type phosphate transport system substrate-binding protein